MGSMHLFVIALINIAQLLDLHRAPTRFCLGRGGQMLVLPMLMLMLMLSLSQHRMLMPSN